jgi:hypothetical protein
MNERTSNVEGRIVRFIHGHGRVIPSEVEESHFFNLGLRRFHGFSLLNLPTRISSVYWRPTRRQLFSYSLAKQKVATPREAWRLVVDLSRSQNGQLPGAGVTSILLGAPAGTSCTATVTAVVPVSFRRICTPWSPPWSMKVALGVPAIWISGVQVGSSPSYAVMVPTVTVIRLGPGWVCHPV